MKQIILFLICSLSILTTVNAQKKFIPTTFIYKITAQETKVFYEASASDDFEARYLYHQVDSFSTKFYQKKLPKGNYLFASVHNERLYLDLQIISSISIIPLYQDKDLVFHIVDSLSHPITDAKVRFGKKKIKYNQKTKEYRLKTRKEEGLMIIETQNDTLFYEIDRDNDIDNWWDNTTFKKWWDKKKKARAKKKKERLLQDNRLKYAEKKGYITINQPKYRLLDTVKVKVYLANKKAKPLTKPVVFGLFKNRLNYSKKVDLIQPIQTITVQPNGAGNYTASFVLGDSLTIDKTYHIYVLKSMVGKERLSYFSQEFRLEDYELDQVTYQLDLSHRNYEAYFPHEKIIATASGKDQNDLFIPDGQVRIILMPKWGNKIYTSTAYIPDTLWEKTFDLKNNDLTQIIIPWEKLPKARIPIVLKAVFFNSSGAFETIAENFRIDNRDNYIDMRIEKKRLFIDYWENGKNIPIKARLKETSESDILAQIQAYTTEIQLPYQGLVNPYSAYSEVNLSNNLSSRLNFSNQYNLVNTYAQQTRDSVFFSFSNDWKLPISYFIYANKKLIKSGSTQSTFFKIKEKANKNKAYTMIYSYTWDGELVKKITRAYYTKDLLKIKIEQPEKVIPSQSVPVKIKVTDEKNQPVPNANLTAVAINSAFKYPNIYDYSNIRYPRGKELEEGYDNDIYELEEGMRVPYSRKWYKKMNLKQDLYYRVRFPEKGVLMERTTINDDPFYKKVAQFAPYITQKGKLQDIHLIYCNGELVYFSGTNDTKPYSFVGKSGYNTIKIRTEDKEWTIDSVFLVKGEKLELAIDLDFYKKNPFHKNISYQTKPTHFTHFEQELLNKTILILRKNYNSSTYIWENNSNIHYNNDDYHSRDIFIGPFPEGAKINIAKANKYKTDFIFEGGFSYEIKDNKARLYQYNWLLNHKHFSDKAIDKIKVGKLIYPPSFVQLKTNEKEVDLLLNEISQHLRKQFPEIPKTAKYKALIENQKEYKAFVWIKDKQIVQMNWRYFYNIQKLLGDDYTLYVYKKNQTYAKFNITLKNDTSFYQKLDNSIVYQIDSNFQLLKSLLKESLFSIDSLENRKIGSGKSKIIKGRITDSQTGEALIGVMIKIKNKNLGIATDFDGHYSLLVRDGDFLEVSYIGYRPKTISTAGRTVIDIGLNGTDNLEEVVVIGYGTKKKSKLVGSLARVSGVLGSSSRKSSKIAGRSDGIKIRGSRSIYRSGSADGVYDLISSNTFVVRSDFRDNAYWQPNLLTDQNGEAYFQTTFPDNITTWDTKVIGMDRKGRLGIASKETKSYKPVMGQIAIPRFLVVGDQVNVVGKALNFTADTFDIKTEFQQNGQVVLNAEHQLSESIIENATITADELTDSLKLLYKLQTAEFGDGEERVISVLEKGVKENVGQFVLLENDTTIQLFFNENYGQVYVTAQTNLLGVLLEEIENLKAYPYGCNEQTASKLLALLWKQKIQNQVNQPFTDKKLIRKALKKLLQTQNADGSWGWWKNGKANGWMSVYIVKVLDLARENGYDYAEKAYQKGMLYLLNSYDSFNKNTKFQILNFLVDQHIPSDFDVKLAEFKNIQLSDFEKLIQIKVQQFAQLPNQLDSLSGAKKQTVFGGTYWGNQGYRWFDNSVPLTLLAYDIYKNAGDQSTCKSIRQYFLEQRNHSGWRNTYESAQILNRILPDVLANEMLTKKASLTINNQTINVKKARFQGQFSNGNMTIQKTGNEPIYFTAYQQFQNTAPKKKKDLFEIKTRFQQGKNTEKKSTIQLEQNKSAKLLVAVNVKESADYIMIEIPIPAGCSYERKNRGWGNYEVHREYFKDKVVIFCERLPVGKYEFSIDLETRFAGKFTINPAKIEQMYFPIFYGRNELKQVKVK